MDDLNLIFIVSQPRSGSTLLQSIISNHPSINSTSEPWLLLPYLSILKPKFQNSVYDSKLAKFGIEDFLKKFHSEESFKKIQGDFIFNLYKPLFTNGYKYVLDKTPRYYEILPEIQSIFPAAKIIVLLRDPYDVLNSIIKTWDVNSIGQLGMYARDILHAPSLLEKFIDNNNNNDNVRRVFYEDIVENPEIEISSLFHWLNIPFEKSILHYKTNSKAKGVLGDQVGVNKYQEITSRKKKNQQEEGYRKYWEKFLNGYQNYLYRLRLPSYQRFMKQAGKPNVIFNDYLRMSSIVSQNNAAWSLKDLAFMYKYKLKEKLRKKLKPSEF